MTWNIWILYQIINSCQLRNLIVLCGTVEIVYTSRPTGLATDRVDSNLVNKYLFADALEVCHSLYMWIGVFHLELLQYFTNNFITDIISVFNQEWIRNRPLSISDCCDEIRIKSIVKISRQFLCILFCDTNLYFFGPV